LPLPTVSRAHTLASVRMLRDGQRLIARRVALLSAAFVVITIILVSLAVLQARAPGVANEGYKIGGHIIPPYGPLVVPPQPWALPAFVGVFLIVLVLATIWHVRRD
jgi:hypothetical protein